MTTTHMFYGIPIVGRKGQWLFRLDGQRYIYRTLEESKSKIRRYLIMYHGYKYVDKKKSLRIAKPRK